MANTYFELDSSGEDSGRISLTACIRRNKKHAVQVTISHSEGTAWLYLDDQDTDKLIKALKKRRKISATETRSEISYSNQSRCMYCEADIKEDEAVVLCKECIK